MKTLTCKSTHRSAIEQYGFGGGMTNYLKQLLESDTIFYILNRKTQFFMVVFHRKTHLAQKNVLTL